MARRPETAGLTMVGLIAQAIADADGAELQADPVRFRRMAVAALGPMAKPTETMVDAAHEAASFDAQWAINSRRDFRKAVKAMVVQAQDERTEAAERLTQPSTTPPSRRRQR